MKIGFLKLFLLFTVHCSLFTFYVFAGTAATSANFLLENLSARGVAMGGLFTATAEGTDAIYSNPAGLGLSGHPEINLSYASTQESSLYSYAGYVHPLIKKPSCRLSAGIGITYYSAGNMDVNSADGTTKAYNAERSYAGMASLGMKFKFIAFGLTPKYIRSTMVEQFSATALGADAGIMIFPLTGSFHEKLILAAAVQNIGNKIKYKTAEFDLPRTDSIGARAAVMNHEDYGSILISAQGERTAGEAVRYRFGGEYGIGLQSEERFFFLRGGYRIHFDNEDFSVGIGIREKNLQIDYAYVNADELEKVHKVTLLFRFGKIKTAVKKSNYDALELEKEAFKKESFELMDEEEKANLKKSKKDTEFQLILPEKPRKQ